VQVSALSLPSDQESTARSAQPIDSDLDLIRAGGVFFFYFIYKEDDAAVQHQQQPGDLSSLS